MLWPPLQYIPDDLKFQPEANPPSFTSSVHGEVRHLALEVNAGTDASVPLHRASDAALKSASDWSASGLTRASL